MICSKHVGRAVSLLVLLPLALTAQVARQADNMVPLKNWATPLYWQPKQAETQASGKALPQLQFSANAVSTDALTFVAITPCRLVDTRGVAAGFNGISPFSGPSIPAKGTVTIPVQSPTEATSDTEPAPCGPVPSIAQAYSFNLTVVPHGGGAVDYVSLWQAGAPQPFVATLNDPQGIIAANAAIVPAEPGDAPIYGGVSIYNDGPAVTDVVIDMNGYFTAPTVATNTAIGSYTLANNTTGTENTASGVGSLSQNTTGSFNTATGASTLAFNTTGGYNTADGTYALNVNTTGSNNTATGYQALDSNTTGGNNTASGYLALASNTTGMNNTVSGYLAMQFNLAGGANTAVGEAALQNNTAGNNTAVGLEAMQSNTTGYDNTAVGVTALQNNTTGYLNEAIGYRALLGNTTGFGNVAIGYEAAYNTTGSNNIAIGNQAAVNVSAGNDNNIHINNTGASGDNGVIKIGEPGVQTSTAIAGISGETSSAGIEVLVNGNGVLGTMTSSRRFKEQITDMGDASSKLLQLRPVNFYYKPEYDDGSHLLQYGLIAEEVAKVYPEMVVYGSDGQIMTVRYQLLAPMLLNEVQKQNAQLLKEQEVNRKQAEALQLQQEENRKLEDRLAALEAAMSGQAATARPAGSQ